MCDRLPRATNVERTTRQQGQTQFRKCIFYEGVFFTFSAEKNRAFDHSCTIDLRFHTKLQRSIYTFWMHIIEVQWNILACIMFDGMKNAECSKVAIFPINRLFCLVIASNFEPFFDAFKFLFNIVQHFRHFIQHIGIPQKSQ